MTKEERHLWYDFLKNCPYNFKRQKIIGSFIVDFCCDNPKIVIELDGDQHYNNTECLIKDSKRDEILSKLGYRVLRFSNYEIQHNFTGVCDEVFAVAEKFR